jgi:hypothetical protein
VSTAAKTHFSKEFSMRKAIRTQVAQNVADHLIPAEAALDEALMSVTQLTNAIISARLEANLAACTAHGAIACMGNVTNLLTQARGELVDAHAHLAKAKKEIGLREVSFGSSGGCPPSAAEGDGAVIMSLVA